MRKFLFLLLLIPMFMFSGCSSANNITDAQSDKVEYAMVLNVNGGWEKYTNVEWYEIGIDSGLIYLFLNNGEVVITHSSNVVIYARR